MTKENNYLLQCRNRKVQSNIDLQQIALEYEKLLNKKFCYIFQGNIRTEFQFRMKNFYHLLGFHKLTDVSAVRMVENNRMSKENFFKYMLAGKITLESTNEELIEEVYRPIISISASKRTSALGEIKASRLAYFSESRVRELLISDPVIDFDKSDCDTIIEADKIFFKLISEKKRNLSLFIGYDQIEENYYTATFFLEQIRDRYKQRASGGLQPVLSILSRAIVNTMNNEVEEFIVKWENVRNELSDSPHFRAQSRLKTWISSKHIESKMVEQEIANQKKLIADYKEDLVRLQERYKLGCLVKMLEDERQKEEAALSLMDYEIDVEYEHQLAEYRDMVLLDILKEINRLKQKCEALDNKLKKHMQFLPDLKLLEEEEVILAYKPYITEVVFERGAVAEYLHKQNLFECAVLPVQFQNEYINLFDKSPKARFEKNNARLRM